MTNKQRKIILTYLTTDNFQWMDAMTKLNQLRFNDDNWYIREDKLPVNRKDGSCSSINQRLIDPLLFDWLVELLPAETAKSTSEKRTAADLIYVQAAKKKDTEMPRLHDESRKFLVSKLWEHRHDNVMIYYDYQGGIWVIIGTTIKDEILGSTSFLPGSTSIIGLGDGKAFGWDVETETLTSELVNELPELDHTILKMADDKNIDQQAIRICLRGGILHRVDVQHALKLFNRLLKESAE